MSNKLVKELVKSGYTDHGAESAAKSLSEMKSQDLIEACLAWLESRKTPLIHEGSLSTDSLMKNFKMTYPAALIFIDWYRQDPDTASQAIETGGGY